MIYVLEDDASILELVLYALNSQNMAAKGFSEPSSFWEACKKEIPNMVILDLLLPKEDGLSILNSLRKNHKTKNTAIILLTALGTELDKIKGLDMGADDYITKPFSTLEFLARVRSCLRRTEEKTKDTLSFDGLTLSKTNHTVTLDNTPIKLTLKEFELLELFLSNLERSFSREELLEIVWGYSYDIESRTVDMHIKTLRQKLGKWGEKIKTIRGIGYKLSSRD